MSLLHEVFRGQPTFAVPSLRGKRCFITGAASGIGRATAEAAAREGAALFLTDVQQELLQSVVSGIRQSGGTVSAQRALDIADYAAVRAFSEDIHRDYGAMDVLMNIAGISVWAKVENMTHAHWKKCVDINLMGPIHVIECFMPEMIRAGRGGYLVNVSSAAGLFGLPWHAAYSASKFGLRGISEVLRFDLEEHRIGVSLVCPGRVATPLVGTAEILGVNREAPEAKRLGEDFKKRAVTPAQAAESILRGMHRGDYLVFTSPDIRVGHWFQNKLSFLYEASMRRLNRSMRRMVERANRRASVLSPQIATENGRHARRQDTSGTRKVW
ncbi:MAG TPA: SDR family oxidoreductase [Polyangiaceae bacterium]|nr:SDR family oxidoreductase [Polyangiaceae bacterium]